MENLRIGDFVAIEDVSALWGCVYKKDALAVGVVVYSESNVSGHGPGVTIILCGNRGNMKAVIKADCNIASYLLCRGGNDAMRTILIKLSLLLPSISINGVLADSAALLSQELRIA